MASLAVADELDGRLLEPALLFAMKLHSGRLADTRDLVVISTRADFDRIERHVHRGDSEELDEQIETVVGRLQAEGFANSFKGVFQQEQLPADAIDDLVSFLADQREQL
ncbi:hypothetical protein C475_19553 [Halosimplex carlsbadense 2-9-1]|uniref:Uncharacterized protein n=1 Tax=Halosimplex carlsbadense 2-9-1 TaxID=797114 RepID=M0CDU9_9EURY|nr:hypothetical protein [Halosimplex carlsbadense]ELZ20828.1 hypothetical protein C475_19553 [Halosimplex carlsbadense 2-9-1]